MLMKYAITGADRETGEDLNLVVDAPDEATARTKAQRRGILVSECRAQNGNGTRAAATFARPSQSNPSPNANVLDDLSGAISMAKTGRTEARNNEVVPKRRVLRLVAIL